MVALVMVTILNMLKLVAWLIEDNPLQLHYSVQRDTEYGLQNSSGAISSFLSATCSHTTPSMLAKVLSDFPICIVI